MDLLTALMDTSVPSTSTEYTSSNAKNSSDCEPGNFDCSNHLNISVHSCNVLKNHPFSESDASESESSDSDSSSGSSASCPICLLKFKGQCIGFPKVCGHPFCLDCILEWSKVFSWTSSRWHFSNRLIVFLQNVRTCPIDRREYTEVLVRLDLDGVVVRKIPVAGPKEKIEEDVLDVTQCQVGPTCPLLQRNLHDLSILEK